VDIVDNSVYKYVFGSNPAFLPVDNSALPRRCFLPVFSPFVQDIQIVFSCRENGTGQRLIGKATQASDLSGGRRKNLKKDG
jgi:hypothetical protein